MRKELITSRKDMRHKIRKHKMKYEIIDIHKANDLLLESLLRKLDKKEVPKKLLSNPKKKSIL